MALFDFPDANEEEARLSHSKDGDIAAAPNGAILDRATAEESAAKKQNFSATIAEKAHRFYA